MQNWIFESKIEKFPNEAMIAIYTRAPLCDVGQNYYSSDNNPEGKGFSILTTALILGLEGLVGVTAVSCKKHEIVITRSLSYTWEEILEQAIPIFVSYCPATY